MSPPPTTRPPPSHLLALPHDIRHCIYQQLFPTGEQIFIQAYNKRLHAKLAESCIPTNILLVCRDLHVEASEFLYNGYLFNLVGPKVDCLAIYKPFLRTLRKYARSEVNVNAFSNGEHSATMCISLQAGVAKMGVLNRRGRGEPKTIRELEEEQMLMQPTSSSSVRGITKIFAVCAILSVLLALVLAWKEKRK